MSPCFCLRDFRPYSLVSEVLELLESGLADEVVSKELARDIVTVLPTAPRVRHCIDIHDRVFARDHAYVARRHVPVCFELLVHAMDDCVAQV